MSNTISVNMLSDAIQEELSNYGDNLKKKVNKQTRDSIKDLVEKTKADAPRGYSKDEFYTHIKSKKVSENDDGMITMAWYVNKKAGLSHLLEDGHKTRRIHSGKSFTRAYHFIGNNSENVSSDYVRKVEEIVRRGF